MQGTQFMTLDAGIRVQGILDANPDTIGKAVQPTHRAELDAAVARLSTSIVTQATLKDTVLGATADQQSQRQVLYDDFLHPIATIARRVRADLPEYPALITSLTAAMQKRVA